ncbi:multicopper oxidase family protein [Plantactinospora sp. KBS50]|uniref:multicopper oxidase family protein n=1 Tax=Plantactinospora sp. KBS50 TaxID=2024580 RepID=UPI000BAAEA0F|nr:multicopper oxidase domain-containing protein [Plantactinospora sp. KBS50]ASW54520.1 hypothetical protein CIK06_10465 [Plantactinospora sp. KBS50]
MTSRRQLILGGLAGGAAVLLPGVPGAAAGRSGAAGRPSGWAGPALLRSPDIATRTDPAEPAPLLDPNTIPKYVTPLPILRPMPRVGSTAGIDEYQIGARQIRQQVLPAGLPGTTVWAYGSAPHPGTFGWPAPTIEARVGQPVRVTWINQLVDGDGRYLPPILPVDPTLHWANPGGGIQGRDAMPGHTMTDAGAMAGAGAMTGDAGPAGGVARYAGPVPLVTHVHGLLAEPDCDGYPEAWYLPDARDIPAGFARVGSWYDRHAEAAHDRDGARWRPGTATCRYGNEQEAGTQWYHDHALGITRLTNYAGLSGFYLLRGGDRDLPAGVLPGPGPSGPSRSGASSSDPASSGASSSGASSSGASSSGGPDEIPMVIQDRSFRVDGSLFYPDRSTMGSGAPAAVPPIWVPGFNGNTMVVNGATWPVLRVGRRRYRFRLLNACNGRTLMLAVAGHPTARPARTAVPIWQIGADNGFLAAPVPLDRVLLAPGQRADIIVDFARVPEGTSLYLVNEAPDAAFDGNPRSAPADPGTTGQVLKLVVGGADRADRSVPPDQLSLPALAAVGPARRTRRLVLAGHGAPGAHPSAFLLGTLDEQGRERPLHFGERVTETPVAGEAEIWEVHNHTPDAHPIHLHGVHFRLAGRGRDGTLPARPQERGPLDTVLVHPGEVTRILARFTIAGRFVWHCHNLEHEDNDMMRPTEVLPRGATPSGDGGRPGPDAGRLGVAGAVTLGAGVAGLAALARRRRAGGSSPLGPPPATGAGIDEVAGG